MHCAKAFKRSGLWDPSSWLEEKSLPSAAKILFEHAILPGSSTKAKRKLFKETLLKILVQAYVGRSDICFFIYKALLNFIVDFNTAVLKVDEGQIRRFHNEISSSYG
jgi:hypothetical protein